MSTTMTWIVIIGLVVLLFLCYKGTTVHLPTGG